MKSKDHTVPTRGMVFAGCSFTWGQGLYYYSHLPTLKEPPPDHYNESFVLPSHKKFKESIRYPRLVANHFNSFEFVHEKNGGSNQGAVNWWKDCFTNRQQGAWRDGCSVPPIDYSDVSHLVFQLTQFQRDNFLIEINNNKFEIPFHTVNQDQYRDHFFAWLDMQGKSLGTWLQEYQQAGIDYVKEFLQECESHNIKTFIFTWPDELLPFIDKDPWLKERFITFDYKGKNYRSITDLMSPSFMHSRSYNPECTIKWDEEHFEITPKDHHPSPTCHRIMAENVIKAIEARG